MYKRQVYDVAFCHNGKPFLIDEHFDRFYNSCRLIKIDFQYSREELRTIIDDLISRLDDTSDVIIYWQASRGTAPRNHPFPGENVKPNLLMYVKPKKITNLDKRMKLVTWDDIRYKMCNVKTINLVPNILAAEHAVSLGCDEAVQIRDMLVTENGEILRDAVTEGAHTNIFICLLYTSCTKMEQLRFSIRNNSCYKAFRQEITSRTENENGPFTLQ